VTEVAIIIAHFLMSVHTSSHTFHDRRFWILRGSANGPDRPGEGGGRATSKDKEGSFRRAVTFKMSLMLQETWVRFGTNGIGISDHQNRYSSGVLVGNYVENEFGNQQQVRTRRSRAQQMKPDGRMEPCLAAAPGSFLLSLPPVADFQPFSSRGWMCVILTEVFFWWCCVSGEPGSTKVPGAVNCHG
jgi:hypothetical protein